MDDTVEKIKNRLLTAEAKANGRIPPAHILALSGGADDGAFGAGLLAGWSDAGNRPEFDYVTGISTGALIAPFAFLGKEWDWVLKEIYTHYSTRDIATLRSFPVIPFSDSATDTAPLLGLIQKYITQDVLEKIAVEYRKGRHLVIGTTYLDAQRPILWNMGLIADSNSPEALRLFQKIMLASSAVPAIFPPVYIDVEINGESYDEMHVDGGVVSQLFVFPPGINIKRQLAELNIERDRHLYLIRNARLEPEWEDVQPNLVAIGNRSISTLIKAQGKNDVYELWEMSKQQDIDYNLASIPDDFREVRQETFDIAYMRKLFEYAYKQALEGYEWQKRPTDVITNGD